MKAQFVTSSRDTVKLKKFHTGNIVAPHLELNTDCCPNQGWEIHQEIGTLSEKEKTFLWQVGQSGFWFICYLSQAVERVGCWGKAKLTLQTCTGPAETVRMVRRCDLQLYSFSSCKANCSPNYPGTTGLLPGLLISLGGGEKLASVIPSTVTTRRI